MKKLTLIQAVALTLSLNTWAADATPQKSQLQNMYQRLNEKAFGSPMEDKIKEARAQAHTPNEEARQIRVILELYQQPGPTKVLANDICSPQGPKFNAYFKSEVFTFSQTQGPKSTNTRTTQIQHYNHQSFAKEKEDFVQDGTLRVSEIGTNSYVLSDGKNETPVKDAKTPINMIDQFVKTQVMKQLDGNSTLLKTDRALLTTELEQAWKFFKRVGDCCAAKECKSALQAQIADAANSAGRSKPVSSGQSAP